MADAYLSLELSPGTSGARRRLRRGGYHTRTQAQRALTALRQPHPGDPRRALLTTGQWLQHWLATRLRPRPATLPTSVGSSCASCAWMTCRAPPRSWPAPPTRDGRPRAASTLHRVRATLRVALNAAMRRGLIDTNPARYLELPPASRPKAVVWTQARVAHWRATGEHPRVAVWTVHQTAQFLHHIRHHRLYPLSD